jgi:hypothetical protein
VAGGQPSVSSAISFLAGAIFDQLEGLFLLYLDSPIKASTEVAPFTTRQQIAPRCSSAAPVLVQGAGLL